MQEVIDSQPFVEFAGYKLAKCSVYDRADYLRAVRDEAKRQRIENFKLAGVAGKEVADDLNAFDSMPWGSTAAWVEFVLSIDGAPRIFTAAAEAFYPGKGEQIARRLCFESENQRTDLLMRVTGLTFADPTPPPTEKNPTEATNENPTGSASSP